MKKNECQVCGGKGLVNWLQGGKSEKCPYCNGTGAECTKCKGTAECQVCGGNGETTRGYGTMVGNRKEDRECGYCYGTGFCECQGNQGNRKPPVIPQDTPKNVHLTLAPDDAKLIYNLLLAHSESDRLRYAETPTEISESDRVATLLEKLER
jgi:hypothetical protein